MITDLPVTNKAYLSAITVIHFSEFYPQDGGENQLAWISNKITSLSPYVHRYLTAGCRDIR